MNVLEQKVAEDKVTINQDEKRSIRKKKEKFLLESNFIIDRLLVSGRVLFNDPISEYVNKVADNLLKNNAELRGKIRFYVAKSAAVNASSSDKGIIMINLGLIAQLENEAQLAFIISHEMVHYAKKHNMNMYLEKDKISKTDKTYKSASNDEKYLAINYHSREIEAEADKSGLLDYFVNSGYNLNAINSAFDVLQYSYLPFDDVDFDRSFLELGSMKFPDTYYDDMPNPIKGRDDYDDTKSTHPNIKSRREVITSLIVSMDNSNKKDFVLSAEYFKNIRDIARFESVRLMIMSREYEEAIYNTYVLSKDYPNNKFVRQALISCLYGMSRYKNEYKYSQVKIKETKVEGKSHKVYHFFDKVSRNELTIMALKFAWQFKKDYPNDKYNNDVCAELCSDLIYKCKLSTSDFSSVPKSDVKSAISADLKVVDSSKMSKYDRIKKQKKVQDTTESNSFKFFLVDNMKDASFVKLIEYYSDMKKADDKEEDVKTSRLRKKQELKLEHDEMKYGKALGIDSILLLNPFYLSIDGRKKNDIKYLDSERNLRMLSDIVIDNANMVVLKFTSFNPKAYTSSDIVKFNEMAMMNDWLSERFDHDEIDIIPASSSYLYDITNKYHSKYLNFTGVISYKGTETALNRICIDLFFPPLLLFELARSNNYFQYYNVLFNTENGDAEFVTINNFNSRGKGDMLNSLLYDSFYQMKRKKRK